MTGHTRRDVAHQAGVDDEYVDRLVEFEILTPTDQDRFSSGDVRRARWIHNFELAGVPLDDIATAVHDGDLSFSFLDMTAFDRFSGLTDTSFGELSTRTGIQWELLMMIREAFGHPEPRPDDFVRVDEMEVVTAVQTQLARDFRPVAIEGWLRSTPKASVGSPRRRRSGIEPK